LYLLEEGSREEEMMGVRARSARWMANWPETGFAILTSGDRNDLKIALRDLFVVRELRY
jgi:hypothetical protein